MSNLTPKPSLYSALRCPTAYSYRLKDALEDLRLTHLDDEGLVEFFAGSVLDIGSGVEGLARGLTEKAALLGRQVTVVSLNPQFVDWRRDGNNEIRYKSQDISEYIADEPFGKMYIRNYRIALAGLVQQLPFRANSFDTVVSTWAFPTVFQESGQADEQYTYGFKEIHRVLKPGGKALLSPVKGRQGSEERERIEQILAALQGEQPFAVEFEQSETKNNYQGYHRLLTLYKE